MWVHAKGRSVGIKGTTILTIFSSTLNSSVCPAGAEREADSEGGSILQARPGGPFATSQKTVSRSASLRTSVKQQDFLVTHGGRQSDEYTSIP